MTREEALDILTHNWARLENPNYEESELDKAYYMAIEALSAEAVQGEWIDTGNWMGIECSRCKCHSRYVTPFCPYCGARMRVPIRPVELKKPFTVDEIPTNYEPRILGNVEAEKKK